MTVDAKRATDNSSRAVGQRRRYGWRQWLVLLPVAVLVLVLALWLPRSWMSPVSDQPLSSGLALIKEQRYDDAVIVFSHRIARDPEDIDAYLYRGIAYYQAERYQASIADFTRVLARDDDRGHVRLYLGDSYMAIGQRTEAIVEYEQVVANADARLAAASRAKLDAARRSP